MPVRWQRDAMALQDCKHGVAMPCLQCHGNAIAMPFAMAVPLPQLVHCSATAMPNILRRNLGTPQGSELPIKFIPLTPPRQFCQPFLQFRVRPKKKRDAFENALNIAPKVSGLETLSDDFAVVAVLLLVLVWHSVSHTRLRVSKVLQYLRNLSNFVAALCILRVCARFVRLVLRFSFVSLLLLAVPDLLFPQA